ncbi:hypothetical protein CDD82_705 [Ophiocordyceps australis]|uniref:AAA+ ATPase domain-containing protein n=1 Tax=Ophiocordyceps australis TaxID=1399860 RepID=A0A2C5ZPX6_9HYPO|nr:hypothetical protein CDD82_705 [Ophiocordyceps australis]
MSTDLALHGLGLRHYSSTPPPPGKDQSERESKKEGLGSNGSANDSTNNKKQGGSDSQKRSSILPPLPPYWVRLTEAEMDMWKNILADRPEGEKKFFQSYTKYLRVTGVPEEFRDIVRDLNSRNPNERGGFFSSMYELIILCRKLSDREAELRSMLRNGKKPWDLKMLDEYISDDEPKANNANSSKDKGDNEEGESNHEKCNSEKGNSEKGKDEQKKKKDEQWRPTNTGGDFYSNMLLILVTWAAIEWFASYQFGQKEITWEEMRKSFLNKGLVQKLVVIDRSFVRVELHPEAKTYSDSGLQGTRSYYFSIGSVESFERKLEAAQNELRIPPSERIPVSYGTEASFTRNLLYTLGPTILIILFLSWSSKNMMSGRGASGGGIFQFAKSTAKRFNADTAVKVRFSDVAGLDEAKVEIMEFVNFLKEPEKFEKLGAKIPRGAILSGPPGTGKTLLAKATAGESGVPFYSVSGSEFVEMFVGVGPSRVRDLFAEGRKNAPSIIFIDEIDAIGRARHDSGRNFGGNDEREATLNQILTEMDGFNTKEQVVVLAGTNRADVLDRALMRPGRFDRHIYIDRPTMKGRQDIFLVYLKKIITKENHENLVGRLATLTPGFSGADISNVVNEAALIAARSNATDVKMEHFEQAVERVIGGLERKSLVLKPLEKKTVAYHEAGHAICGWFLEHADPLLKVSIIPRGQGALGYAQYLPQDAYLMNSKQLMDRMAMIMGGRVSEELHFPTVTTGASDDFKKATHLARNMVTEWGMSEKVGPVHFDNDPNRWHKPFAEATARDIDEEVSRIVAEGYRRCKDLLTAKKKEVGLIAEELLKKEVLAREDMLRILGPRPFEEHEEFEKYFGGNSNKSSPPASPPETKPGSGGQEPPPAPRPAFKMLGQGSDGQNTGLR